jgi:hypothetical protein
MLIATNITLRNAPKFLLVIMPIPYKSRAKENSLFLKGDFRPQCQYSGFSGLPAVGIVTLIASGLCFPEEVLGTNIRIKRPRSIRKTPPDKTL